MNRLHTQFTLATCWLSLWPKIHDDTCVKQITPSMELEIREPPNGSTTNRMATGLGSNGGSIVLWSPMDLTPRLQYHLKYHRSYPWGSSTVWGWSQDQKSGVHAQFWTSPRPAEKDGINAEWKQWWHTHVDRYRYDMIWYDMTWYDMIWFDMIWHDMIWYDMTWYDIYIYICADIYVDRYVDTNVHIWQTFLGTPRKGLETGCHRMTVVSL